MIGDAEAELQTPPNTLIVFEGARIMHKVTPLAAGERQVLISMTYCGEVQANFAQASRRFKDTAFFGVRALWTELGALVRWSDRWAGRLAIERSLSWLEPGQA